MEKVRRGVYNFEGEEWDQISEGAKRFIDRMLQKDPKKVNK